MRPQLLDDGVGVLASLQEGQRLLDELLFVGREQGVAGPLRLRVAQPDDVALARQGLPLVRRLRAARARGGTVGRDVPLVTACIRLACGGQRRLVILRPSLGGRRPPAGGQRFDLADHERVELGVGTIGLSSCMSSGGFEIHVGHSLFA